jgi:23S rRNA pseudouridine1911/1915/1917 synthase
VEEEKEITAQISDKGLRLDIVLSKRAALTRSAAGRLIDEGRVHVEGISRKPSFKIMPGMHIRYVVKTMVETSLLPAHIPLDIMYEDDWIIVIDKPAGLVVHPGAGNRENTLVNALIARYPEIVNVGSTERPGIVHRLDKLTSGVMVIARNAKAYYALADAFKAHAYKRVYLCMCYGHMPKGKGRIATLMHRHPKDRKRMSSKVKVGKEAVTNWEVLRSWPGFSLLSLSLETGRTHQIRVHLSDIGHPIVGDAEYGGRSQANEIRDPALKSYIKGIERQMLHAHILGIQHPDTGEYREFFSPLPADMQALIRILDSLEKSNL